VIVVISLGGVLAILGKGILTIGKLVANKAASLLAVIPKSLGAAAATAATKAGLSAGISSAIGTGVSTISAIAMSELVKKGISSVNTTAGNMLDPIIDYTLLKGVLR
jgi:hypothetical protein